MLMIVIAMLLCHEVIVWTTTNAGSETDRSQRDSPSGLHLHSAAYAEHT